ncbi:MAG: hypothetical protein ACRDXD_02645 [Acidimicrobiia bacterium]
MVELEQALRRLGDSLEFPAEPELAGRVRRRIEHRRPARPLLSAWVAAALILVAAAFLLPGVRRAAADLLGLDDIRIVRREAPPVAPAGAGLDIGLALSLAEVRERVDFEVLVPSAVGEPDAVYLDRGRVTLLYRSEAGLPEVGDSGVGLLINQFGARLPESLGKELGPGTSLETVTVRGRLGYWIEGEPHLVYLVERSGEVLEESGRLAGNTLLWQEGRVTFRLESALSLEEALQVAESLR